MFIAIDEKGRHRQVTSVPMTIDKFVNHNILLSQVLVSAGTENKWIHFELCQTTVIRIRIKLLK